MPDVVTVGEALIGLTADGPAPLADVTRFRRHVVGAEANVAVGLARLGRSVAFVGRVGDDGLGRAIVRRLRGEGVDTTGIVVDPSGVTGVLIRERRALGASEVLYHRRGSAGSRLTAADVSVMAECVRGARWLHLTGITPALSTSARDAVEGALDLARQGRATVSLDINLRRKLWSEGEARSALRALAARADVVFGDPDELAVVAGGTDAPLRLLEAGAGTVVVKLGQQGAALYGSAGIPLSEPALPVTSIIDPVGAGDGFCAGFIAARLEGHDDRTTLRWANASGAAVISVEGDMDGLPTLSELHHLLAQTGLDTVR